MGLKHHLNTVLIPSGLYIYRLVESLMNCNIFQAGIRNIG